MLVVENIGGRDTFAFGSGSRILLRSCIHQHQNDQVSSFQVSADAAAEKVDVDVTVFFVCAFTTCWTHHHDVLVGALLAFACF